jgi:hypothetical protein
MPATPKLLSGYALVWSVAPVSLAGGAWVAAHVLDDPVAYLSKSPLLDLTLPYALIGFWWVTALGGLIASFGTGAPGRAGAALCEMALVAGMLYLIWAAAGDLLGITLAQAPTLCRPGETPPDSSGALGFLGGAPGTGCEQHDVGFTEYRRDLLQLPLHLGASLLLLTAYVGLRRRRDRLAAGW